MFYFGTKGRMQWVKPPTVDFDASRQGWSSKMDFLDGTTSVRRSLSSHATMHLSWSRMSAEQAQMILRPLRSGEPVYFADPFVKNQFPQSWAEPWRAAHDGPILDGTETRPVLSTPVSVANNYPDDAATYTLTAGSSSSRRSVWLPIPDGYTLHIGAKGAVVSGTPVVRVVSDAGAVSNIVPSSAATGVDYTHSFTGTTGVTVSLQGTGELQLQSLQAELVLNGSPKPADGFSPGEGMGGALAVSEPAEARYSAALPHLNRAVSVALVEVASWQ